MSDREQFSVTELTLVGNFGVENRLFSGSAAPTIGDWRRGDIVFNSAPAANGTIGWVCTTAGRPGTWKTFGPIAA